MGKIEQVNQRLKDALVRVRVERHGDKLHLRATLPPKPNVSTTQQHQQRISLEIAASPAGVALAEKEARKVGALLDCKQFDWTPYLTRRHTSPSTVADWLTRFEAEFRGCVSDITWQTDYDQVFRRLPPEKPLTVDLLVHAISATRINSRTRERFCMALGKLAKTAGLTADFKPLQGTYSHRQVEPRSLPTDQEIVDFHHGLSHPGWRWVYGMMATFGLRNHEVFFLDTADLEAEEQSITVLKGKTGRRQVWAYHPEWIDQFSLRKPVLPDVTGKQNSDFGDRVTHYLRKVGMPFKPYDLRHAWAVRTMLYGLPDTMAAQQMGHSVTVHNETYHHWITAAQHQAEHDRLMARSDRPVAPLPTTPQAP